jgi:tetratricopeptide (TPR) repeat protein
MKPEEWFRRTEWTPQIATAFEERLRRSRTPFNKAQYLRIQGLTLIQTRQPALLRVGMELTQRVLDQHSDSRGEISQCHHTLGNAHESLGEYDRAIECYRKAWAYERKFPSSISGARGDLAMLIVKLGLRQDADEALAAIEPRYPGEDDIWPIVVMRKSFVRASVASWRGNAEQAAEHARVGLRAAAITRSPLRYHPTLGLAGKDNDSELAALKRFAGM